MVFSTHLWKVKTLRIFKHSHDFSDPFPLNRENSAPKNPSPIKIALSKLNLRYISIDHLYTRLHKIYCKTTTNSLTSKNQNSFSEKIFYFRYRYPIFFIRFFLLFSISNFKHNFFLFNWSINFSYTTLGWQRRFFIKSPFIHFL